MRIFCPRLEVGLIVHFSSFVHPEDPNWPGLKPTDKRINFASPASRRASANLTGKTRFSPKRKASSPDDRPERRSAPLVSQNDLFQKCKIEADEAVRENYGQSRRRNDDEQGQNRSRGRGSKSSRERRSRNPSASSQKPYETRTYHAIEQDRSLADHTSKLGSYRSRTVWLPVSLPYTRVNYQIFLDIRKQEQRIKCFVDRCRKPV